MLFQTAFAPELIHGCRPSPLPSYHTFEQSKERARSAAPLLRTATARGSKPGAVQQTHPKRQGTSASEEAQAPRQANTCLCQFPAINRVPPTYTSSTPWQPPSSLQPGLAAENRKINVGECKNCDNAPALELPNAKPNRLSPTAATRNTGNRSLRGFGAKESLLARHQPASTNAVVCLAMAAGTASIRGASAVRPGTHANNYISKEPLPSSSFKLPR